MTPHSTVSPPPVRAGSLVGARRYAQAAPETVLRIERAIAAIDAAVSRQVDAILHAPPFQALEASWRGLLLVLGVVAQTRQVRLRLLDATWQEVARDLDQAVEFDQSTLFTLVYDEGVGMPGGHPFGLIVADYAVAHRPTPGRRVDDVAALQRLAAIGAAAFCPVILGASPSLLGVDDFGSMGGVDVGGAFDDPAYLRWRALRGREDTRFLGLALPRVLFRRPYRPDDRRRWDGFRYAEDTGAEGEGLLWGNAAFVFAIAAIRRFDHSGWFADLRGVPQDRVAGGLVTEIPPYLFPTDAHGIAAQPPLEIRLSGVQEQQLSDLGIIPLTAAHYTSDLLFNSNASLHSPVRYDRDEATWNARISSMLQYILCVSRFSHYLMVMMRDRVGGYSGAGDVQRHLATWINAYCLGSDGATDDMRARFPLRSADVEVNEVPGRPGALGCTIRLQPHFQLDSIATTFRLVTNLATARR